MAQSKPVTSNQLGVHENLAKHVAKHATHIYEKPIAAHTTTQFTLLEQSLDKGNRTVILDSGCGTAQSSYMLARAHPDHVVIGVDKSGHRLKKALSERPSNLRLVRADLSDFWRLLKMKSWQIDKHYIFYPNPWPKAKHLQRRWHGHAVFPAMLTLSAQLELRTNWKIYALEFVAAIEQLRGAGYIHGEVEHQTFAPKMPISAFEKKYLDSGHELHQVTFHKC